jgi:hypothetical protein
VDETVKVDFKKMVLFNDASMLALKKNELESYD